MDDAPQQNDDRVREVARRLRDTLLPPRAELTKLLVAGWLSRAGLYNEKRTLELFQTMLAVGTRHLAEIDDESAPPAGEPTAEGGSSPPPAGGCLSQLRAMYATNKRRMEVCLTEIAKLIEIDTWASKLMESIWKIVVRFDSIDTTSVEELMPTMREAADLISRIEVELPEMKQVAEIV